MCSLSFIKKVRDLLGNNNDIHVNIAEVKIGKNGDILKATLGSCVGIAFLWKAKAGTYVVRVVDDQGSSDVETIRVQMEQ